MVGGEQQPHHDPQAGAMMNILLLLSSILAFAPLSAVWAQGYVDPQKSMFGYKAWCGGLSGTFYNDERGVGCIPGSGTERLEYGGQTYGGYNPYEGMLDSFGNFMSSFNQQQAEIKANQIRRTELARKKAIERGMMMRRQAQRKSREYSRDSSDILSRMRITASAYGAPRTERGRAACGGYLLTKAEELAGIGKFSDAAYLSGEAGRIVSGKKPEVICPEVSDVPKIKAGPVKQSREMAEFLKKHARVYGKLYGRVDAEMDERASLEKKIALGKKTVVEKLLALENSKKKLIEMKGVVPNELGSPTKLDFQHAARAIENKKAELEKAQQDARGNERGMKHLKKRMKETHDLFQKGKNPKNWDAILKTVGVYELKERKT